MNLSHITTIFSDNDGVLVDSEELFCSSDRDIFEELGITFSMEGYKEYSLVRGTGFRGFLQAHKYSEEEIQKLRKRRNELYIERIKQGIPLMPGVEKILGKFAAQFTMGLVTTSHRPWFELVHQDNNLERFFEFFITREDVTHSKPHPEPYLLALEKSGKKADECLVIEDTPRGIASAKAAGLTAIAIPTDFTRELDFSEADGVLGSMEELEGML